MEYGRVVQETVKFLDTVNVTGINNASALLDCVAFLQKLASGDITLVEVNKPKPQTKLNGPDTGEEPNLDAVSAQDRLKHSEAKTE